MRASITTALSDEGMIALARELAAAPRERFPWYPGSGPATLTIAGSDHDQAGPNAVENPFWQIVREMPADRGLWRGELNPEGHWGLCGRETLDRAYAAGLDRSALCGRYSWSIPSPGDIAWICGQLGGRGIPEIGAGSGYWAWQLEQAGVDVAAYDPHEPGPENRFVSHRRYTAVREGDHTAAAAHPDRALMLCWPSYGAPFARQALQAYAGEVVIYIGEGEGGCCADDDFFDLLQRGFEEAGASPSHVTWSGIHCRLSAWTRKAEG